MNHARPLPAFDQPDGLPIDDGQCPLRAVLVVAPDAAAADVVLRVLQRHRTCRFLAWVQSPDGAVRRLSAERFDLVLLVGFGPTLALAAIRRLRVCVGSARVLVLAKFPATPALIDQLAAAGAGGLLDCNRGFAQLPGAAVIVARGHSIFPPGSGSAGPGPGLLPGEGPEQLTKREREVMELIAQGRTARQAAEALSLSVYTVENYLRSCYRKLHSSNRVQACNVARYYGFI